ncbi:Formin-like protein [Arachis hypogaea]|nr:Formin-like protein [Arachis hypogaea]
MMREKMVLVQRMIQGAMPKQLKKAAVLAMDESVLDVDQVKNLIKFCPTKEEMELLKVKINKLIILNSYILFCQVRFLIWRLLLRKHIFYSGLFAFLILIPLVYEGIHW